MANGRVLTGFSKPYVALYSHSGSTVTYTSGQILARGVSAEIEPDSNDDENIFYADNVASESVAGEFTGGSLTLTVDGLLTNAEKLLFGLPVADVQSMQDAVNAAYKMAQKGETVLLSPCCASFDLFKNMEDRGEQFKTLVRNL